MSRFYGRNRLDATRFRKTRALQINRQDAKNAKEKNDDQQALSWKSLHKKVKIELRDDLQQWIVSPSAR